MAGERLAGPERVVPVAAGDPLAGLERARVLADPPHERPGRRGVAQVDGRQLEPAADEMRVPVSEARQHETAIRPDHVRARADVSGDGGRVADGAELTAAERPGARLRSAAGKAGPDHAAPNDDVGRAAAGGQRKGQQTQASASSHALSLPELGDAADRLERRDGVGRATPGGASLGLGGRDGERVADVEQHLEQELLALIGGVDVGHPGLVAGGLGALVGLAVNRLEISEDALAGSWTHGRERYSFAT